MRIKMFLLLQLLSLVIIAQTNYIQNTDVQFVNNNFGCVIRNDGIISITKNGGINWTQSLVKKDVSLRNFYFVDELRGWVTTKDRLYKTNDAGATWVLDSSITNFQFESILFINDSTGFIGGQSSATMDHENKIFVTRNFGNSWTETNIDTNYYNGILDFSCLNDSIGIAVGSSTIYKTIDGGNNWNQLSVEYGIPYMISSARMIDENKILGFIAFPDVVFEGYIIISNDGGLTWDKYGNKQNFMWGITDQYFFSIDNGWLTAASKIYHTVNSGSSWDTLRVNVSKFNYFDVNNALGINDKEILLTNDGWNTFIVVDSIVTDIITNDKIMTNHSVLVQCELDF